MRGRGILRPSAQAGRTGFALVTSSPALQKGKALQGIRTRSGRRVAVCNGFSRGTFTKSDGVEMLLVSIKQPKRRELKSKTSSQRCKYRHKITARGKKKCVSAGIVILCKRGKRGKPLEMGNAIKQDKRRNVSLPHGGGDSRVTGEKVVWERL